MANRETKYDAFLGIPVGQELKDDIAAIAEQEERTPTEMARMLLKEIVAARKPAARGKRTAAASSK